MVAESGLKLLALRLASTACSALANLLWWTYREEPARNPQQFANAPKITSKIKLQIPFFLHATLWVSSHSESFFFFAHSDFSSSFRRAAVATIVVGSSWNAIMSVPAVLPRWRPVLQCEVGSYSPLINGEPDLSVDGNR